MKIRLVSALVLNLAFGGAVLCAQDVNPAPLAGQNSGTGAGGGYGRRGQRGMGMRMGRGVTGTVTEAAADHFTVKTFSGETYTVHFSVNTRIMKQGARMRGEGGRMRGGQSGEAAGEGNGQNAGEAMGEGPGEGIGQGDRTYMRGNPPQPIKASDIKVGDAIAAMGEIDSSAKSVGAVAIVQLDPERARQMRAMEANFGKTWLMGRVAAIDGVKVTLSGPDNADHSFLADENTSFRQRREPITLADIHVGDVVRADGALKDGAFTATAVYVMRPPQGGPADGPSNAPPQPKAPPE
jgi:hypothetical protein